LPCEGAGTYGRVHNSITSLRRTLRPSLRIAGQPLGNIDIVQSRPAFLAVLINQRANQGTHAKGPSAQTADDPSIHLR
jgi:hypothetical protein